MAAEWQINGCWSVPRLMGAVLELLMKLITDISNVIPLNYACVYLQRSIADSNIASLKFQTLSLALQQNHCETSGMKIAQFIELLGREKATAILRTDNQGKAALAMEAAIRGGFKIIEFTLTVPGAYELIQDFSKRGDVVVGAGTVLDTEQAQRAVEAGAKFLVSPVVDEAVIQAANELGVASFPGTHTATEMLQAHRTGATFCKLFPAPQNGPAYLRAILGPLPFLKIVPTSGVDQFNAGEGIAAGAFAVGFVAPLFDPDFITASDWDAIEQRAVECLKAAQS